MMVGLTSPQLSTVSLGSEQIYEQTGDHAPKVAQMHVTGFVEIWKSVRFWIYRIKVYVTWITHVGGMSTKMKSVVAVT